MKLKKRIYTLIIAVFLMIIFLPSVGLFKKTDEEYIKKNLNRMPYQFPEWHIDTLSQMDFSIIEKWYADKASFIATLSKMWADMNYYFGISAKPDSVIIGKNGWFFTGNSAGHNVDLYTGKEVPTEEDIILLVNGLKRMSEVAKQYHIPFVVLVAPEAIDIYSEYLPNYLQKKSQTYTFEQISKILPEKGVDFIDLRPVLIQAKQDNRDLYLKGDPHWNYLGAYMAYQALAKDVKLKYGLSLDQHKLIFSDNKTNAGAFTNDLQRDDIWSTRADPDLSNVHLLLLGKDVNGVIQKMEPLEGNSNYNTRIMPYENINLLSDNHDTCLLMSDSYAETMGVYFHNDFYDTVRIHYYNTSLNLSQLIQRYHPKLIVFEITSRALHKFYNDFSPHTELLNSLQYKNNSPVSADIQSLSVVENEVKINGWAYIPHQDAANSEIYLKLLSETGSSSYYLLRQEPSPGVKQKYTDGTHLGVAGFSGVIEQSSLPEGNYKASIIVKNGELSGEKTFDTLYSISYHGVSSTTSDFTKKADTIDLQLLNIPLNTEVKIVPNMPRQIWFFQGWSGIEPWGVWTNGNEAAFIIPSKNFPKKFKLVLSYSGFIGPGHLTQSFEMYNLHKNLLKKADFEASEHEKITTLNINQERDSINNEYLPIWIKVLNPGQPSVIYSPSSDSRLLGMGLKSIKIVPDR